MHRILKLVTRSVLVTLCQKLHQNLPNSLKIVCKFNRTQAGTTAGALPRVGHHGRLVGHLLVLREIPFQKVLHISADYPVRLSNTKNYKEQTSVKSVKNTPGQKSLPKIRFERVT